MLENTDQNPQLLENAVSGSLLVIKKQITLDEFSNEYKSLLWFKPMERFNINGHLECMFDMYQDGLKENPKLTVKEFTIEIINHPEMQEANKIIGIGLKPFLDLNAIEFSEWIRTFDALDKKDGFWVLESQISSEELYKNYLRDRERWRNDR